jgi:hypothetical protein
MTTLVIWPVSFITLYVHLYGLIRHVPQFKDLTCLNEASWELISAVTIMSRVMKCVRLNAVSLNARFLCGHPSSTQSAARKGALRKVKP